MNFLRRAAPLAILASGQLFVLVSGGFDLSVGSLVTLTVIGGSMLTANDPSKTWWAIAVLYGIGPHCRAHQRRGRRLSQDPVDHRHARDAAVGQRRGDDVVGRLAARLSARQFSRVRSVRVPRRAGDRDIPARRRGSRRGLRARAVGAARHRVRAPRVRGRRQSSRRRTRGRQGRIRAPRRLRHFGAVRGHRGHHAGRLRRRFGRCRARPRIAGDRGLRGRRRAIDGRARHGRRRGRRGADPRCAVHAAHSARLAAAAARIRRKGSF